MKAIWQKLPTWLKAIIWVIILLYPTVILNQALIVDNITTISDIPWAFFVCLIVLWFFWQFATGKSIPFGESVYRFNLSQTSLPRTKDHLKVIGLSLSLLLFIYGINAVGFGLFGTETTAQFEFIKYVGAAPGYTGTLLLLAAALTAGIVEEITFRGYMQRLLTQSYGPFISFILVGIVFTVGHLLPPELYLQYFLVSIAFSWVAHLTGSVIPGIIVHITFDFIAFMMVRSGSIISEPSYMRENLKVNISIAIVSLIVMYIVSKRLNLRQ